MAAFRPKIISVDGGNCEVAAAAILLMESGKRKAVNLKLNADQDEVVEAKVTMKRPHGIEETGADIYETFYNFKASPKHFDEKLGDTGVTRREVYQAFYKNLVSNIRTNNPDIIRESDKLLLYVGIPSSAEWESEKEAYRQMILEAVKDLGVEGVRVVPESRAAIFSALQEETGGKEKIRASEGVGVVDLGSSTTDFTYMKSGKKCIEFSRNLRAADIEKMLRRKMRADVGKKLKKPVHSFAELDSTLRRMKEAFFSGELDPQSRTYQEVFPAADGTEAKAEITVDEETMRQILEEKQVTVEDQECNGVSMRTDSWKGWSEHFFHIAVNELNNEPANCLILTGGASRMEFVQECAKRVFPKASVICAREPQFSVSHGLAWVGELNEVQEECVNRITDEILSDKEYKRKACRVFISDEIEWEVSEKIMEEAGKWNNSADNTLSELKDRLEKLEKKKFQKKLEKKADSMIHKWNKEMNKKVVKKVNKQIEHILGNSLSDQLKISDADWEIADADDLVDFTIDVESIVEDLDLDRLLKSKDGFFKKLKKKIFGNGKQNPMYQPLSKDTKDDIVDEIKNQKFEIWDAVEKEFKDNFNFEVDKDDYKRYVQNKVRNTFEILTLRRFGRVSN